MDDLAFLETLGEYDASNASLKVSLPDGRVCHISDRICPYKLLDTCPLLYHAFEYGFQSRLRASIEAPSRSAVISLLRYCYTGNYLPVGADNAPILLPHAEIYKMAADFDVSELQLLAQGNFSCQVEFACCLPAPPRDLLETISFVYQHYADQQSRQRHGLVDALLNYCISNFLYHKLGENTEFLKVVSGLPEFRQDLCRTNMERNFKDECAFAIIRLALDSLQVQSGIRPTVLASRDLPQEMLFDMSTESRETSSDSVLDGMTALAKINCKSTDNIPDEVIASQRPSTSAATTLVHRPRNPPLERDPDFETDTSSDNEGCFLVHHPKSLVQPISDEPMSSPELLPLAPIDILAATGSDYSSDDEWTML